MAQPKKKSYAEKIYNKKYSKELLGISTNLKKIELCISGINKLDLLKDLKWSIMTYLRSLNDIPESDFRNKLVSNALFLARQIQLAENFLN